MYVCVYVNTHGNSNKKQTTARGEKKTKQRRLSATQMKQKPRDKAFIIISTGQEKEQLQKQPKIKIRIIFFLFNSALLIAIIFVFVLLFQVTTDEGKKRGSINTVKAELTMAARKSQSSNTKRRSPRDRNHLPIFR